MWLCPWTRSCPLIRTQTCASCPFVSAKVQVWTALKYVEIRFVARWSTYCRFICEHRRMLGYANRASLDDQEHRTLCGPQTSFSFTRHARRLFQSQPRNHCARTLLQNAQLWTLAVPVTRVAGLKWAESSILPYRSPTSCRITELWRRAFWFICPHNSVHTHTHALRCLLKRLGRLITRTAEAVRTSVGEQKVSVTTKATRTSFASLGSSNFFFFFYKKPCFFVFSSYLTHSLFLSPWRDSIGSLRKNDPHIL